MSKSKQILPEFVVATEADAETLTELRVVAMRPSLEAIGRFDPEVSRARFRSTYTAKETVKIMSREQLLGFYVLRDRGDHLYLDHLYIAPDHQGRGLGSIVMNRIKGQSRQQAIPVRLGALKNSRANAFYTQHGFNKTHEEDWDNYYCWEG